MANSSAVMIAETVEKQVVYSAPCFDQKPTDSNTQLVVEYSVMSQEAGYMTPEDNRQLINNIDGALKIVTGSLKIGAVIYPPAAIVLVPLAYVGSGLQMIAKRFKDDKPDLVTPKFQELEKAFVELEKTLDVHFTDMQLFLSEHHFDRNITIQAGTLMRFMRNCLKNLDEQDVENFTDEYENNNPLSLAYYLAEFLEKHTTNPLRVAMDLETAKTKATFNKWKTIITGIFHEYLLIETFAMGLLGTSDAKQKKIIQAWEGVLESMNEWEETYKKDQGYWTVLKEDFVTYFKENTHLNNAQKSLEIKERLDTYLTSDAFYICVFNETDWETDYAYYCFKEDEQICGAWRKGRCNAFVYRSRKGSTMSKEAYSQGKEWYKQVLGAMTGGGSLKNIIKTRLVDANLMNNCFYCMFLPKCEVQINYLNHLPEDSLGRANLGPGQTGEAWVNKTGGLTGEYAFYIHLLAFE